MESGSLVWSLRARRGVWEFGVESRSSAWSLGVRPEVLGVLRVWRLGVDLRVWRGVWQFYKFGMASRSSMHLAWSLGVWPGVWEFGKESRGSTSLGVCESQSFTSLGVSRIWQGVLGGVLGRVFGKISGRSVGVL